MESEMQRFERLCKEVGIQTTTLNFRVDQRQVYKFFQAVIKDCEKNDKIVTEEKETKPKDEDRQSIESRLKRYSKTGLTTEELSNITSCPIKKTQEIIAEMVKEGLVEEEVGRWKLKKTS